MTRLILGNDQPFVKGHGGSASQLAFERHRGPGQVARTRWTWSILKNPVPLGRSFLKKKDGPGKWNKVHLNQSNPSMSNQTNPKDTPIAVMSTVLGFPSAFQPSSQAGFPPQHGYAFSPLGFFWVPSSTLTLYFRQKKPGKPRTNTNKHSRATSCSLHESTKWGHYQNNGWSCTHF